MHMKYVVCEYNMFSELQKNQKYYFNFSLFDFSIHFNCMVFLFIKIQLVFRLCLVIVS